MQSVYGDVWCCPRQAGLCPRSTENTAESRAPMRQGPQEKREQPGVALLRCSTWV